jgi:predicted dehydrogenase
MQPLGVGIIGFGRIGAEHAGWLAACDGAARAVAVDDVTPARRTVR